MIMVEAVCSKDGSGVCVAGAAAVGVRGAMTHSAAVSWPKGGAESASAVKACDVHVHDGHVHDVQARVHAHARMQHVHAARACSMCMQHVHAARACSVCM